MLENRGALVKQERNSRKQPLTDREARELIASVGKVVVARGRKFEELPAAEATLAHLKGPTGNYRAPMLRRGKTLLVGFHAETLDGLV